MTMSTFCIQKVIKNATKNLKIDYQIKVLCQKIILNKGFSHCKNVIMGSNYFLGKKFKTDYFSFKMHQTKTKLYYIVYVYIL